MSIQKHVRRISLGVLAATLSAAGWLTASAQLTSRHPTVTAEQAIACVRTASAAKPGLIREVEVDDEKGARLCEVKIVAEDGKKYEIYVDVAADKVVRIKED
jgi:uncharacterized membrane protein YkoI